MPRTAVQPVTEVEVAQWVKIWQDRLRLADWKIEAKIVRASELKPDTLGNLRWNSDTRTALIRVLDPVDYDLPPARIAQDMELTIVHELVHLHLSVLPRDPTRKSVEEQVVDKIASALFNLEKRATTAEYAAHSRSNSSGSGSASRIRSGK
jgi:hypothetical protein